jgi:phage terminase Nu1 subunit (DNA packaging protein)
MLGKAELAQALGWSRPRLDRRLAADPYFPIVTQGDGTGGWEFDLEAVKAHLAETEKAETLTPRARRETAMAVAFEMKNQREAGELVRAEGVVTAITTAMAQFGKSLDSLPEALARRLGLPADRVPVIREEVDRMRRAMVVDLRKVIDQNRDAAID